jgi:hypothetical protein
MKHVYKTRERLCKMPATAIITASSEYIGCSCSNVVNIWDIFHIGNSLVGFKGPRQHT